MKDNSLKRDGIIAISALFGVLAAAVALVAFAYSWLGAALIGLIVAIIVAIILWLGWRDANASGSDMTSTTTRSASAATGAAVATGAAAAVGVASSAAAKTAAVATTPAAASTAKPAAKASAKPAAKAAAKAKAAGDKPEVLSKARAGGPDNLKMIKGVGPVLEKSLHDTGVFHFDQVGKWTNRDAKWFDDNVKGANGRVVRDEWVKQARILAKGGTTEFANKVKKGGVY